MSTLAALYETDYHAWALRNADLLKQGKLGEADIAHIIEELEGLGSSNKDEIESRLIIILLHLLKWQFQRAQLREVWEKFEAKSWRNTIVEQRYRIARRLRKTPSLKSYLAEALEEAYPDAVKLAAKETGLPVETFPGNCPYSLAQILDDDFYPET